MDCLSLKLAGLFFMVVIVNVGAQRFTGSTEKPKECTTRVNHWKNVCYWYDNRKLDQASAQQVCASQGGSLVVIDSPETNALVKEWVTERPGSARVWLGYDKDHGAWYDGSAFRWTKWCGHALSGSVDKCVIDTPYDCWNDVPCSSGQAIICQKAAASETRDRAQWEEIQVGAVTPARSEKTADHVLQCTRLCLQDPLCWKFNFHPTTRLCALYVHGAVVDETDGSQTYTF